MCWGHDINIIVLNGGWQRPANPDPESPSPQISFIFLFLCFPQVYCLCIIIHTCSELRSQFVFVFDVKLRNCWLCSTNWSKTPTLRAWPQEHHRTPQNQPCMRMRCLTLFMPNNKRVFDISRSIVTHFLLIFSHFSSCFWRTHEERSKAYFHTAVHALGRNCTHDRGFELKVKVRRSYRCHLLEKFIQSSERRTWSGRSVNL